MVSQIGNRANLLLSHEMSLSVVMSSYCIRDAFGVPNGIQNSGKSIMHVIFICL
jgi:hypothetical protein